jgi:UDP-N-acetylglucosamine 2-epimerase (non-hydrolysing)
MQSNCPLNKILVVLGTRPEVIKMAPLILSMKNSGNFHVDVCCTGQHTDLIQPVLEYFGISPQFDLRGIEFEDNSLNGLFTGIYSGITNILLQNVYQGVVVHGDTLSASAGALAAFYNKIHSFHVEAGLRSFDMGAPWPEEGNRKIISTVTNFHFAPTELAKENLLSENVPASRIKVVGNTAIDALYQTLDGFGLQPKTPSITEDLYDTENKKILVTAHRRENLGEPLREICCGLRSLVQKYNIEIQFSMHPNPAVRKVINSELSGIEKIELVEPLNYPEFVRAMHSAFLIISDSGGIQEEAPSMGTPVMVLRDVTERPEALEAGHIVLVGSQQKKIVKTFDELITNKIHYLKMARICDKYGLGNTAQQITCTINDFLNASQP